MTTAALTDFRPAAQPLALPVAAGRVLVLAGAVFASANLFQYGLQSGHLPLHPAALALSWPLALTVFFTGLARIRRSGGEATKRVAGWSRAVIGLTAGSALILAALSATTGDWALMRWTSVVSLALYGGGWSVAALRAGGFNTIALAAIAFLGAAALAFRIGSADQYVIQSAALALVALLPGLWLAAGRRL